VLVSHDTGTVARSVPSVACLNRRLFIHPDRKLTRELLESAYGDAVDALDHDHGAFTDDAEDA
jgi:zinc transport system ATP-binding protein